MNQTITKKIKVQDYTFEIENKNITKVNVTYEFGKTEIISYENGKRKDISYADEIAITLSGVDNDDNEAWISFLIKSNLEELNKYTDIPKDISKIIHTSEAFVKSPKEKTPTFLNFNFATNTLEDIYENLSYVWISKLEENIFVFKVCVPNDIFASFKVDFN